MRILIADDHPIILEGTRSLLLGKGFDVVAQCSNGSSALSSLRRYLPDVAILDISMPEINGLEVARLVQEEKLPVKVVLLTMHNEKNVYTKALSYGVWGYILKNFTSDELFSCLDMLKSGKKYTSPNLHFDLISDPEMDGFDQLSLTEKKIVEFISQQLNNKQIGDKLFISERTIEWHRRNIIEKLKLPKEKNSLLRWVMQHYQSDRL